jgi:hypothetical protein
MSDIHEKVVNIFPVEVFRMLNDRIVHRLSTPESREPSQSGGVSAGAVADGAPSVPFPSPRYI